MPKCRFTGVNHWHDGEQLDQGDIVELTEAQYAQWSYQFERVDSDPNSVESEETVTEESETPEESEESAEDSGFPEDTDEPVLNPGDYTIAELQSELQDGDYSDEELVELADAEIAGKDRSGAKEVISAVREE